jgi:hypothetical protein
MDHIVHSDMLTLNCGVRQGGILSPHLFFFYIDDIVETVIKQQIGCVYRSFVVSIILYADDRPIGLIVISVICC